MKILVTGGSGFVGKNVIEYLLARGYDVIAPSSKDLDCLDEVAVREYLENNKFDFVFHFAVYSNGIDKTKDGSKMVEYNLRIFLNFYKCAYLYSKMFYSGSGAEYDKRFDIVSVSENDIGKSIPTDPYGVMKYTVAQLIEKSENIYNLRLFGIYGKYEYYPLKYISNMCCKAIKNVALTMKQNVYFDYLWIDDFCRMLEFFLTNEPKYHTYNMVSGKKISLQEICEIVLKVSGKQLPIHVCREGLANEYTASNDRFIAENPDFKYTSHEQAIRNLYNWYSEHEDEIDIYQLVY